MLNFERVVQLFDYVCTRLEAGLVRTPTVAVDRMMLSETVPIIEVSKPQLAEYLRQRLAQNSRPTLEVGRDELMELSDQLIVLIQLHEKG